MADRHRSRDAAVIRLYARVAVTRALGPGRRYALWVQGCPFHCPGCLAPDSLPFDAGERFPVARLANEILAVPGLEGVTISGGEPFAQAPALVALLDRIRPAGLGIIVYTGYTLAALRRRARRDAATRDLLERIDLLIDGPYMARRDDGGSLRGSANQQVHCLTPRYAAQRHRYGQPRREVEIHPRDDGLMLVGVPGPSALESLRRARQAKSLHRTTD